MSHRHRLPPIGTETSPSGHLKEFALRDAS